MAFVNTPTRTCLTDRLLTRKDPLAWEEGNHPPCSPAQRSRSPLSSWPTSCLFFFFLFFASVASFPPPYPAPALIPISFHSLLCFALSSFKAITLSPLRTLFIYPPVSPDVGTDLIHRLGALTLATTSPAESTKSHRPRCTCPTLPRATSFAKFSVPTRRSRTQAKHTPARSLLASLVHPFSKHAAATSRPSWQAILSCQPSRSPSRRARVFTPHFTLCESDPTLQFAHRTNQRSTMRLIARLSSVLCQRMRETALVPGQSNQPRRSILGVGLRRASISAIHHRFQSRTHHYSCNLYRCRVSSLSNSLTRAAYCQARKLFG